MAADEPSDPDGQEPEGDEKPVSETDPAGEGEETAEEAEETRQYQEAVRDPLADAGGLGGASTARLRTGRVLSASASASLTNTVVNQITLGEHRRPLIAGRLPAEELDRRCRLYDEVENLAEMTARLREQRVIALCGMPDSGRLTTGIVLLHRVISADQPSGPDGSEPGADPAAPGPQIIRLEPDTDLSTLAPDSLEKDVGYLVEPVAPVDRPLLTDLHLDRLSALLAERHAYAVVLISDDAEQAGLLRGRYGLRCLPPDPDGVLRRQLTELVPGLAGPAREAMLGLSREDEVVDALGVGSLRPAEVIQLAELLVAHEESRLDRAELLTACAGFAKAQVVSWFRPIDGRLDRFGSVAATRAAAFHVALAVYEGSSYAVVAEAAESLAGRLSALLEPEEEAPLPLFADDPAARTLAARAIVETGVEEIGRATVPVERIRYAGTQLGPTVLTHVWATHHSMRPAIVEWLCALSHNVRPQIWVPAAQACGELAQLDFSYAAGEIVAPLAEDDQPRSRLVAATVLHGAAADKQLTAAVTEIVRAFSRSGVAKRAWTAAATYSLGLGDGPVRKTLREIARIGSEGDLVVFAGWCVVQLLGGDEPGDVLAEVSAWSRDERPERRRLALFTTIQLATARTADVVAPDAGADAPLGTADRSWPLCLTLSDTHEEWATMTSDLIRDAFKAARSGSVVDGAIKRWIRGAVDDEDAQDSAGRFLERLVTSPGDLRVIRNLLDDLVRDEDEPLPVPVARHLLAYARGAAA